MIIMYTIFEIFHVICKELAFNLVEKYLNIIRNTFSKQLLLKSTKYENSYSEYIFY